MLRPRVPPDLAVSPREAARLGRAAPGFGVHVLPCRLDDLPAGDDAAAERTGEPRLGSLRGGFLHGGVDDGLPILIEAVGVAVAGVAHERAAALLVGGAVEEDGVVGMIHANRTPYLVPLLHVVCGGARRSRWIS